MRQSVLVALALVALLLLPNKSFSQYQPPSETLVIRTDHASTWSDGQTTIILTVVLFAIWIIVLDARAGVRSISPSLVEMAQSFGANRWQAFSRIYVWAALPEILAGVRLGVIRAVKGVIIGQILVSIVGFGALFKLYGSRFLMEHFWAALLVLFAFAFLLAEGLAWLERRVEYYAASRA